jgi:type II secretory pathway pseudopilin PulG
MRNQKGQSLFELVVAIAISALVVSALVSITTNSIQNAIFSKNKALAGTYGQQTAEWLRGQRDSDPVAFQVHALTPQWCMAQLAWTSPGSCGTDSQISGTIFTREVNLVQDFVSGKTIVQADVVVSWEDSLGSHSVTNATNLSDWRER